MNFTTWNASQDAVIGTTCIRNISGDYLLCRFWPPPQIHWCWISQGCYCCSFSHVWLFATPGTAAFQASLSFTISQNLLQTHVHWVSDAIQPPLPPLSPFAFSLSPHQGLFHIFASGGQSIGASASASAFPMNIQGWFPLGLTGLTSLCLLTSQLQSPPTVTVSIFCPSICCEVMGLDAMILAY